MNASSGNAAQYAPNDYDAFAEAYAADNESSLANAYYTLPAVLDLAGDVAGRHVLDAGCGSGTITERLRDRGAVVAGFDASAEMLRLARQRLGADVPLQRAELGRPLPYPDAAFDDVVAALVLHYLEDWTDALAELRRVLKPGGRLIAAVNHPFVRNLADPRAEYFTPHAHTDQFTFSGRPAELTFWHRPLHAMTAAFTSAGFRIAAISEPPPAPEARELFPDIFARFSSSSGRFLCFLFFVLEAA